MNTKIVYVLVSTLNDVYYTQTLISAFSARYWNKDAEIVLVVDNLTDETLKDESRQAIMTYVDNKIVITMDDSIDNKCRSRILKTGLRGIVDGDYVFLDSDTIVCGSLSEVDSWECPIGMVYDAHRKFDRNEHYFVIERAKCIGEDVSNATEYFNSGFMYVKDTDEAKRFCHQWQDMCLEAQKRGMSFDQPTLLACSLKWPIIKEVSGCYNCQVLYGGLPYLAEAKVIHIYNAFGFHPFYLFNDLAFLRKVKKEGVITEETKSLIITAKSRFSGEYSLVYSKRDLDYFKSSLYHLFCNCPRLFRFLERAGSVLLKLFR